MDELEATVGKQDWEFIQKHKEARRKTIAGSLVFGCVVKCVSVLGRWGEISAQRCSCHHMNV